MGQYYLGLDVHSRQSVFVVEREDGTVTARGEIPTTTEGWRQLGADHGLPAGTAVALETGTLAFYVARELAQARAMSRGHFNPLLPMAVRCSCVDASSSAVPLYDAACHAVNEELTKELSSAGVRRSVTASSARLAAPAADYRRCLLPPGTQRRGSERLRQRQRQGCCAWGSVLGRANSNAARQAYRLGYLRRELSLSAIHNS